MRGVTGADLPGRPTEPAGTPAASAGADPAAPTPGPPAGGPGPATPATASPRADSRVSQAIALLDGLADRPLAEHPDAYQQVHEALQGALADIDDA